MSGSNESRPMLDVTALRKVYQGSGRTVEAIGNLSFSLDQGEFACIVGPSGAARRPSSSVWPVCWSRPRARYG